MTKLVLATENGEVPETAEDKAKQLPKPAGYHILCAIPEVEEEFENGFIKSSQTVYFEEMLTTVLFVVAMGPDAYKDPKKFPSGTLVQGWRLCFGTSKRRF